VNERVLCNLLYDIICKSGVYDEHNAKLYGQLCSSIDQQQEVETKVPNIIEVTQDNYEYENFEFDGIICFRDTKKSSPDAVGIIIQDAFFAPQKVYNTKGQHYDGYGDQNALYFHNDDCHYLPRGIYFNSSSRINMIERCLERGYLIYKCKNVKAFAYWLLGQSVEEINRMEL